MKEEEAKKLKNNQLVYYLQFNEYCAWGKDEIKIQKGRVEKVGKEDVYFQLEYLFELGLDNVEKGSYETMVEFERVFPTLEEAEAGKARVLSIRDKKRSLDWAFNSFFQLLKDYIVETIDYHNDDFSAYNSPPKTDGLQQSMLYVLEKREELEKTQKEEEE